MTAIRAAIAAQVRIPRIAARKVEHCRDGSNLPAEQRDRL
jgi:hypothetical protein